MTKTQASRWLKDNHIKIKREADLDAFSAAYDRILERHADDDALREAALVAAAKYLAHEITERAVGSRLAQSRARTREHMAAARAVAEIAVESGLREVDVAKDLRVDRMAVRDWVGKRVR